MSLVSLKNLALPFRSKVHLVTIVLAGVVFAVLRLSTGAIEVRNNAATPADNKKLSAQDTVAEAKAALAPKRQAEAKPLDQRLERRGDTDLLGEIVGPAKKTEAPHDDADLKAGALDDIERSLGLR